MQAVENYQLKEETSSTTKNRILHVDDDPCVLEITKNILELEGNFEVDNVSSVEEALKKLEQQRYDVIISDYEMPQKNGLQFLQELREKHNNLPFVMFTGKGREEVAVKALNLGADGYYNKQGSPETVFGELSHGIRMHIERKRSQNKLDESQHFVNKVLESTPNLIYIYDLIEHRNIYVNKEILSFLGYTPDQVKGMGSELFNRILHPEDHSRVAEHQSRFATACEGDVFEVQYRMKHANGEWRWLSSRDTLFARTKEGSAKQILGSCGDITERKKAEAELKENENKLRGIFNSLPDLVFFKDNDLKYIAANKALEQFFGLKPGEAIGKSDFDFMPIEVAQRCSETDIKAMQKGQFYTEETINGKIYLTVKQRGTDKAGNTIGVVGSIREITEFKETEAKLRESEDRYRSLFEQAPLPVSITALDGTILEANNAMQILTGYSSEELKKINAADVYEKHEDRAALVEALKSQGVVTDFSTRFKRKNGAIIDVSMNVSQFQIGGKNFLRTALQDITDRKKAEKALRESEEKHRKLFEGSLDAIFLADAETGILIDCNPAALELVGREKSEIIGHHQRILHPKHEIEGDAARVFKQHQRQDGVLETQVITKTGETKDVSIKSSHVMVGGRKMLQGVFRDITESKKAEEALRETKEYLDNLLNYANAPIIVWDNGKRITLFNTAFEAFTGLKREHVLGRKIDLLFPPTEKEEILQTIESASKGQMWQSVEIPILCADKETRVALWNSANIQDKNGNIVATIAQGQDITERKTAEEKLKKLKAFDERIIDSLDHALLLIDPDNYKIISANETTLKQLKLKKEDLIGKTCYETTHYKSKPCQPPEHNCPILKVLETKKTVTVEHTHFDKNNNERIMEVSASLVKNPEGKTVVIHVARDITKAKQMETRIREAEKQYHALFSQAPFGILIIDPQTATPIEFNKIAHEQLGYSREEFAKLSICDYKAFETQDETKDRIAKILKEGSAEFEVKHRTKNGEIRDISITAQAIELSGKTLIHSIYRDVTDSKKVDEALRESETKYRQLIELAQEGVWALDNDNHTVYVNPRMAEMLGYAESEILGKNLSAFLNIPDISLAQHNLEDCKHGNPGQCEFEFTRKDGTRIYASIAASSIQDDTGNNTGTLALVSDITERKKAELSLKESHEKLEMMNEKLRVVGGLTRHDARNKLCVVMGNAYLIKKKHADQAGILERLDKMELAVKEIEKIFDFAKMYEQLGVEELSFIDVERTVTEAVALFSDLTVKVVNECKGLTLLADSFLRQLFYNFIDNTRKYGKTANTIRVYYEKEDNDKLRLIYLDDGVGISVEDKLRLFEEGFSTGGSTGFGLFLSKKMMDVYGWSIQETGELGKGAKFVITIPKTSQKGQGTYKIQPKA